MEVEHLNSENFEKKTNQPHLVVVDFFATWCGPCKMMAPIFEQAKNETKDVDFYKIDVDENEEIASKFGVMSIPTLVAIKNGKEVDRNVGLINRDDLNEFVDRNK